MSTQFWHRNASTALTCLGGAGWVIEDEGTFWVDFNHRKVELEDRLEVYIIEMLYEPMMDWKEHYY